jgi:hypothetical protein
MLAWGSKPCLKKDHIKNRSAGAQYVAWLKCFVGGWPDINRELALCLTNACLC